jgi:hypothetical protein
MPSTVGIDFRDSSLTRRTFDAMREWCQVATAVRT